MLGAFLPPGVLSVSIDDPEHPSKEAFTPVSPRFGVMLPFTFYRIQRKIVGVLSNQMAQLPPRKLQRCLGSLIKRACVWTFMVDSHEHLPTRRSSSRCGVGSFSAP